MQVLNGWKQSAREFLGESLPPVVCVAYWHIEDCLGHSFVLGIRVGLDHGGHPFLKSIRSKRRDIRLLCRMLLNKVMLASHIAVYLAERRIRYFPEDRCSRLASETVRRVLLVLTMPWVDLIFEFDLLVEFEHLSWGNDQAVLWFVIFDLGFSQYNCRGS
jgi:hypothetical protein